MLNNLFNLKTVVAGSQMLFVAFGALVLMPLLTGLDPSVALFTAGIGTLLFQVITGASIPVFLASSFVFIAPISYSTQTWGIAATMGALIAAGVMYMLMALLVRRRFFASHYAAGRDRTGDYGDRFRFSPYRGKYGNG